MTARKPFPWHKLTPAQISLMERLASEGGTIQHETLEYGELLALDELRKLKLADMRTRGRSKLHAILTELGAEVRQQGYQIDRVVLRVTEQQIELMRYLDDGFSYEDSVGRTVHDMPGPMRDVCRRMRLRGWVEWQQGRDGRLWAQLTYAGREVLMAIDAFDEAVRGAAEAREKGRLQ